ncbi:hypothetical protein OS242_10500 [Tumebacillus sp. DT12]|uniref:Zinc finger Ogr/Delta-type domain-containing protein n=1 Tax=Tumebacillus lacus TaxID=2995335 RepID=A0ABT3X0F7_9BACL|nr:hypothetical protein [Tumebacillus lacus]MCX7570392.1 hypothetical protein [Tumebacillus lacus]
MHTQKIIVCDACKEPFTENMHEQKIANLTYSYQKCPHEACGTVYPIAVLSKSITRRSKEINEIRSKIGKMKFPSPVSPAYKKTLERAEKLRDKADDLVKKNLAEIKSLIEKHRADFAKFGPVHTVEAH